MQYPARGFIHWKYQMPNDCRYPLDAMPSAEPASSLPYFTRGEVVRGFGRGSKELGIPTANYPVHIVDNLPAAVGTGIYYGWASVDRGPVYKMVMSIGWNPFYKNTKKSMETHIIHSFEEDFYGSKLSVVILGFLRPEKNYPSLDALIEAIKSDINEAEQALEKPELKKFASHAFFSKTDSEIGSKDGVSL